MVLTPADLVLVFVALCVGAVIGYLGARSKSGKLDAQIQSLTTERDRIAKVSEEQAGQTAALRHEYELLMAQDAANKATIESLHGSTNDLRSQLEAQQADIREKIALITDLTGSASRLQGDLENTRSALQQAQATIEAQREELRSKTSDAMALTASLSEAKANLNAAQQIVAADEERIGKVKVEMSNIFQELSAKITMQQKQDFDRDVEVKRERLDALLGPFKERLDALGTAVTQLGQSQQNVQTSLTEQISALVDTQRAMTDRTNALESATSRLSTALSNPKVRGSWGEQTLANVIEISGMSPYCDAVDQESLSEQERRGRPDVLIRIPHTDGERVPVDAKVPGGFFKAICEATNDIERQKAMADNARAMITHVDQLADRDYSQYAKIAPFVIMFLPNEGMLSAALAEQSDLIERAERKGVFIATPLMLLLYLRSYAFGWRQVSREENIEHIAEAAKRLYRCLGIFVEHFDKVGKSLNSAAMSYTKAVGSYERFLLPSAQRIEELGAGDARRRKSVEGVAQRNIAVRQVGIFPPNDAGPEITELVLPALPADDGT